jgi:hypothetical protein
MLVFGFPTMAFANITKIILGSFEILTFFGGIFFTPILHVFFGVKKTIVNLFKHNHWMKGVYRFISQS